MTAQALPVGARQCPTDETKTDAEWLEALVMIVADKPAESWADEDITQFEINLSETSCHCQTE